MSAFLNMRRKHDNDEDYHYGTASQTAFDEVWSGLGWEIVPDSETTDAEHAAGGDPALTPSAQTADTTAPASRAARHDAASTAASTGSSTPQ